MSIFEYNIIIILLSSTTVILSVFFDTLNHGGRRLPIMITCIYNKEECMGTRAQQK